MVREGRGADFKDFTLLRSLMITVPDDKWLIFLQYSQAELADFLKEFAKNVRLSRFKNHPRGPKKPAPKRNKDPKQPHVSTARLIADRKKWTLPCIELRRAHTKTRFPLPFHSNLPSY
jgi:hypothetical protein